MTTSDFYKKLEKEDIFENEIFDLKDQTLNISQFKSEWVTFENCTFNCKILGFKNINDETVALEFINCSFNCNVIFSNCIFDRLTFKNTKFLKSLNIGNGRYKQKLNFFEFSNDLEIIKPELTTNFNIRNTIIEIFSFENIKHINGDFKFLGNKLGENDGNTSFQNTIISNVLFGNNSFLSFSSFKRMIFNSSPEYSKPSGSAFEFPGFYRNKFSKISFSESNFIGTFQFDNCDFLSTTWFENCNKTGNNDLKFVACKFEKYSLFDNSKFNKIEILHSKFLEKASFENFETNYFKIHQVTFAESAYFDDLNKNNNLVIENWDRKTLRAIKRELVNTHNQIDYLRFKAYELEAFKKEKGKSWKDNSVLFLNQKSNYFGLDWTKGFWFTTLTGFGFYLLYLITYAVVMRKISEFPNTFEDFSVIYLKFLNPFSFLKSPIQDAEKYFFPSLFFMFGKISVSYGIYQTVQAFRKFGVNGG